MLRNGLYVLVGGGIGAAWREVLMASVADLPGGYPMPIFIANMTAALLIGVFATLAGPDGAIGPRGKLLLVTGLMGGLSTFSSLIWGTEQMLAVPDERAVAIGYLLASMVLGLLLVRLGLWLGARLVSARATS